MELETWHEYPADLPDLFDQLRAFRPSEVRIRLGIGTAEGYRVEVPASSLTVQGRLCVEAGVDRLSVEIPGWGDGDFAWFGRRKGRGRPDYWQIALEYRPEGRPHLVYYGTAAVDGLRISVREPITSA